MELAVIFFLLVFLLFWILARTNKHLSLTKIEKDNFHYQEKFQDMTWYKFFETFGAVFSVKQKPKFDQPFIWFFMIILITVVLSGVKG